MLKKILFALIFIVVGGVLGGIGATTYSGYYFVRGMFMLQDNDIIRMEIAATDAYFNESPEVAIWAMERYLDFFNEVVEQRITAIETTKDRSKDFFIVTPGERWISYVRLALLYEKTGNDAKAAQCFQAAADIKGWDIEKCKEPMIELIRKLDERVLSPNEEPTD